MSTTSANKFKVYAEAGDIMDFEVTAVNDERRLLVGVLDTAERCVCPLSLVSADRLGNVRGPHDNEPGTTFSVRVLDVIVDSSGRRRILVSEKHVEERLFHQHLDRNTAESDVVPTNQVPAEVLANARQKRDLGHTVKGVVVGDAPGGGKRVDIGKFVAILSREDMCGTRADSLRKGVTVKVKFKDVSENCITLTRKDVA